MKGFSGSTILTNPDSRAKPVLAYLISLAPSISEKIRLNKEACTTGMPHAKPGMARVEL